MRWSLKMESFLEWGVQKVGTGIPALTGRAGAGWGRCGFCFFWKQGVSTTEEQVGRYVGSGARGEDLKEL